MPTFLLPGTGEVMTPVGTGNDYGESLAVQTDGKVLLGGFAWNGKYYDFALVRYNTDGSLDTGFGQGGRVTTPIGGAAWSITTQSDGKILLGGGAKGDFALARYNADGSLDTSFGQGGKVTTPVGSAGEVGRSITIQADGKILLGGMTETGSGRRSSASFALARYNADGSLDTGFGQGGTLVTSFGQGKSEARSVTIQADGKILLGGWAWNGTDWDFALARYTAAGTLDTSFGQGGKVLTPIGSASEQAYSVTVQADGKILLAGDSDDGDNSDFAVVRYNADGSLDTGFGQGGKALVPVGPSYGSAQSVRVQADGKIVLGGWARNAADTDTDFAVVRLNADGSLDTRFGATDTLRGTAPFTEGGAAVVLAPAATLADPDRGSATYAGGTLSLARQGGASPDDRFSAKAGGSLGPLTEGGDLTYGGAVLGTVTRNSGGVLTLTFTGGSAAQVSGALREITYANASANPPASVALAWSFAEGSAAPTPIGVSQVAINAVNDAPVVTGSGGSTSTLEQVAIVVDAGVSVSDPDNASLTSATVAITGGFVSGEDVLGFSNTDADRFGNIVGRYDAATGVLSLTSSGGTATLSQFEAALRSVTYLNTSDTPGTAPRTIGMAVNDGSLTGTVASRTVSVVPVDDAPSFVVPGTGKVLTPVGTGNDYGESLAVQTDGKVLLGGFAEADGTTVFAVVRYNVDGSLDTSFGQGGKVTTPVGSTATAWSITTQPDGKILLGGSAGNGTNTGFALVRYNADGSLDTGFGQGGQAATASGSSGSAAYSVTIQADGKILLGGGANGGLALVRYNADGSLDTGFGQGGQATTAIGSAGGVGHSVTIQPDGKILLGGRTGTGDGSSFALARYNADGSLDTGFGQGGTLVTPVGQGKSDAWSVATQPDGKILLGGWAWNGATWDFALARYTTTGALDTSFGQGGTVLTPVGSSSDQALSVTIQPDGRILLAGSSLVGSASEFAVVRYNADGSLDTGFGQGGKALVPVGSGDAVGQSATVLSDGRIFIGGSARNATDTDFAVVRLNADGSLDTRFGATSSLDGTAPFTEGGGPVVLAPSATLADPDRGSATYAGGTLSLARQGGASPDDRFSAKAGGSLGPLTEGGDLTYGGTLLGTVTRNSGGVLTLTFTGGSAEQVSGVLREIAYANASANPPASVALAWSFAETDAAPSPIGVSHVAINAVNDAPVVTGSGGSTSTLEQVAIVVDAGVSVSDPDNASLASATVAITGGFVSGQDVLGFDNTDATRFGNIVGRYDAATGVLSLTSSGGTATLSQFEAALRSVTYLNTSDTPDTAPRTIGMSVNDGSLDSAVASRTVSVVPVNDAPVVTASSDGTAAPEQVAIVVDAGVSVSDPDNASLASATVAITGGFVSGQDVLGFDNTDATRFGNIVGHYDAATGVLSLTSSGARRR
ncbi:hypothetical protein LRS73_34150 (plasmid) [Methylobacterium currus]|uniref:beta strand repeat-containing protein n=1 Tax=Methylobacterium currus TaxID=2051553 RepID=UPI001E3D360B|nr:hypothetical protein [Methylobacterium currus]UHC20013.1 hypothetical protein LRS73_34150 [Methylobacterium currus]